jgi:hypothetical protein
MLALLVIGAIAHQGAGTQAPPPSQPRVMVTAPVYYPDASVTGETTAIAAGAPSVVYMFSRRSLCDTAASSTAEPGDAGYGWRVASQIVSASPAGTVVSVDWRRLWDRGQKVASGPSGTAQLTLHAGDRIPLDHIPNARPTDGCRALGMGLEMRLGRAATTQLRAGVSAPIGAREGGTGSLDVDLWLVHTTPTGTERAQHQTVRLGAAGGPFTFAPVKFATAMGEVGVELDGAFQRYTAASGSELLLVSMTRVISGGAAPSGGLSGTTRSLVALPRPDEVLSFEMTTAGGGGRGGRGRGGSGGVGATGAGVGAAAGQRSTGGGLPGGRGAPGESLANALQAVALLDGHRFALRVRVTPVPGM